MKIHNVKNEDVFRRVNLSNLGVTHGNRDSTGSPSESNLKNNEE